MRTAVSQDAPGHQAGRHGICPGCRRTFRVAGGEVPAAGVVLTCPECGSPVPVGPQSRRRRPYRIVTVCRAAGESVAVPDTTATRVDGDGRDDEAGHAAADADEASAAQTAGGESVPSGMTLEETPAAETEGVPPTAPAAGAVESNTRQAEAGRGRRLARALLGLAAGALAGAATLLVAQPEAIRAPAAVLSAPVWAQVAAAALPLLGLAAGLLLGRRP